LTALCPAVLFTAPTSAVVAALSLHDALPIYPCDGLVRLLPPRLHVLLELLDRGLQLSHGLRRGLSGVLRLLRVRLRELDRAAQRDRKSTRLNSSHVKTSYAVFCLKKKN